MQSLLTYAIEIVFWAFVTAFLFDLIDGLFPQVPDIRHLPQSWDEPKNEPAPQTEAAPLPDPWLSDAETTQEPSLPAPAAHKKLLLLPPAPPIADIPVAPKHKRGRPKKIA